MKSHSGSVEKNLQDGTNKTLAFWHRGRKLLLEEGAPPVVHSPRRSLGEREWLWYVGVRSGETTKGEERIGGEWRDAAAAGNVRRCSWKVAAAAAKLIQADRLEDKESLHPSSPTEVTSTLSNLCDGKSYTPPQPSHPSTLLLAVGEQGGEGEGLPVIGGEKLQCFVSGRPQGRPARD